MFKTLGAAVCLLLEILHNKDPLQGGDAVLVRVTVELLPAICHVVAAV